MFALRPMQPADGPALRQLMENDPPAEGMSLTTKFLVDPYEAWTRLKSDLIGVVAQAPDNGDLIGVATAAFEETWFNGRALPAVDLENVKTHHAYRGQGLATRMTQWLVTRARERFGDEGVIMSRTSTDNIASINTMKKWAKQEIQALMFSPVRARKSPPKGDFAVRPPEPGEYAQIAEKANQFHAGAALYRPLTADHLAAIQDGDLFHYRVAVDTAGEIAAGAMLSQRCRLMVDMVANVPPHIRVINLAAHILPEDNALRLVEIAYLWFRRVDAGRQVWDSIRWEFGDCGNNFGMAFDPRGPVAAVVNLKPWHQPRIRIALLVSGPERLDEARWLAGALRG